MSVRAGPLDNLCFVHWSFATSMHR